MFKLKLLQSLIVTNIKATVRDKGKIMFIILFPLAFVGVFAFAYGGSTGELTLATTDIGIYSMDQGAPDNISLYWNETTLVTDTFLSQEYSRILSSVTYPNTSTPVFNVNHYTEFDVASQAVENRDIVALVQIPENFSLGVLAAYRTRFEGNPSIDQATNNWTAFPATNFTTNVIIEGDRSLQEFNQASSLVEDFTEVFFNFGEKETQGVKITVQGNLDTSGFSAFDYLFPGVIIFAVMLTMGTVTDIALTDVESGTLKRVKLTNVSSSNYVISLLVSHLFNACIQIPVLFGGAMFFGFPLIANQLILAFVVSILLSLSVAGIGLIIAGIVSSSDSARELANIAGTPLAFLSGAFFMLPNPVIIEEILDQHSLRVFDLIPSTPALRLLRGSLLYDRTLTDIIFDFGLLSTLTFLLLFLGLFLYKRKYFKAQ